MLLLLRDMQDGKPREQEFTFDSEGEKCCILGSSPECDIVLTGNYVAPEHLGIGKGWLWGIYLRDLGSDFHTYFKGEPLHKRSGSRSLKAGDHFYLGPPEGGTIGVVAETQEDAAVIMQRLVAVASRHAAIGTHSSLAVTNSPIQAGGNVTILQIVSRGELPGKHGRIDEDTVPPSHLTPAPLVAGSYKKLCRLDSGGMANIYLSRDETANYVAIKTSLNANECYKEYQILSLLHHENIVKCRKLLPPEVANDSPMLVLEFVNGPHLADYRQALVKAGKIKEPWYLRTLVRSMVEIADALICCHNLAISHQDVKPQNVLLTIGKSVLLDFGIAKMGGGTHTMTYESLKGTLGYIAPEKFPLKKKEILGTIKAEELPETKQKLNFAIDGYGLGATFYYGLTGRVPVEDTRIQVTTAEQLIQAISPQNPPEFQDGDLGDAYLHRVCLELLCYDWQKRTDLRTFKTRLQLWLLMEAQGKTVDWKNLAGMVLGEGNLDMAKFSMPEQTELAEAVLQETPPYWEGSRTPFAELSEDERQSAHSFWIATRKEGNGILVEIRPQVTWLGKVLVMAEAVRAGGEYLEEAKLVQVAGDDVYACYSRATQGHYATLQEQDLAKREQKLQEALESYDKAIRAAQTAGQHFAPVLAWFEKSRKQLELAQEKFVRERAEKLLIEERLIKKQVQDQLDQEQSLRTQAETALAAEKSQCEEAQKRLTAAQTSKQAVEQELEREKSQKAQAQRELSDLKAEKQEIATALEKHLNGLETVLQKE